MMVIAEIGQAHDGSLGILHSYIDAVATTGVNAVKFQTHIAAAESSELEPFRVPFSYVDSTRFDYWRRMEFTQSQWREIKRHCEDVGLEFISTPFSMEAVRLLEMLDVKRYKVGSGDTRNLPLIEMIARTGKEILLSSGMSAYADLDAAVDFLRPFGNRLTIMQCTSEYPVSPAAVGLNVIGELRGRYMLPVGFSDHTGSVYAGLAAAALGAEVIEAHVTFDKRMFGPDSKASLTIAEFSMLVEGVRCIEKMLVAPVDKNDTARYQDLRTMFGRSLAVNRDAKKGESLSLADLETKKPAGAGIPAERYREFLGRKLTSDLDRWTFLQEDHFE